MTQITPDITALMDAIASRHGTVGMKALAEFMFSVGSETVLCFGSRWPDVKWTPCDFVMQMAWERGGQP